MKPQEIMVLKKDQLYNYIDTKIATKRSKKIHFYAPSFIYFKSKHYRSSPTSFPSISITGSACTLKCKHCNGRILSTMFPALTPEKLFEVCTSLKKRGALGCLISGGCRPDGTVPLGKYVDTIEKIKRYLGLKIIIHTGIINFHLAKKLKGAGVDAALIDIIGSDETIQEIYRLNTKVKDYNRSLKVLNKADIPVIPHVLVGLHYGKIKGELKALEIISKHKSAAIIIIALMPIYGTLMKDVNPPLTDDIARVLVAAKLMMPKIPIALGCMRPKGEHRVKTDILAIKSGVNGIAFPTDNAIQLAKEMNLKIRFSSLCCSQIFEEQ